MPADLAARLAENLAGVRRRIERAAERSGRAPDSVRLVAVTKYASTQVTRQLAELGCWDLGESRPQQLWAKAQQLADLPIRWHLIGHLQRNKVRRTLQVPGLALTHSLDSQRLVDEVERVAAEQGATLSGLLEVRVSAEVAKHGVAPQELPELVQHVLTHCPHLRLEGLMGMASLEGGIAAAAKEFQHLRQLWESLATGGGLPASFRELSMGMSGDYEQAIEAGATIVRVGSALFAGLEVNGLDHAS